MYYANFVTLLGLSVLLLSFLGIPLPLKTILLVTLGIMMVALGVVGRAFERRAQILAEKTSGIAIEVKEKKKRTPRQSKKESFEMTPVILEDVIPETDAAPEISETVSIESTIPTHALVKRHRRVHTAVLSSQDHQNS